MSKRLDGIVVYHILSVLVASSKKNTLHGGQPRSWSAEQKREKENKIKKSGSAPPPPPTRHAAGSEKERNKNHATHLQALGRSRSVSRPHKDSFDSSTSMMYILCNSPNCMAREHHIIRHV